MLLSYSGLFFNITGYHWPIYATCSAEMASRLHSNSILNTCSSRAQWQMYGKISVLQSLKDWDDGTTPKYIDDTTKLPSWNIIVCKQSFWTKVVWKTNYNRGFQCYVATPNKIQSQSQIANLSKQSRSWDGNDKSSLPKHSSSSGAKSWHFASEAVFKVYELFVVAAFRPAEAAEGVEINALPNICIYNLWGFFFCCFSRRLRVWNFVYEPLLAAHSVWDRAIFGLKKLNDGLVVQKLFNHANWKMETFVIVFNLVKVL